jgi:putative membrane protein
MMTLMAVSTSLIGFFGGGWILFPLFWVLLIVGIVFLVRGRGGSWTDGGRETAIDVLDRRFAAGELGPEEYRERRAVLEEKR